MFGFAGNLTITSYVSAKGKAVLALSTMHHDETTEGEKQKPSIILHYNAKKSGVANMDHLATLLSCKRKSNRWPMVLFYNLLDVAGVAGFVIWMSLNPEWAANDRKGRRRKYLKQLAYGLTNDWIDLRTQNVHVLQPAVVTALHQLGKVAAAIQRPRQARNPARKRCQLCRRPQDNKTSTVCSNCNKYVCGTHSTTVTTWTNCEA